MNGRDILGPLYDWVLIHPLSRTRQRRGKGSSHPCSESTPSCAAASVAISAGQTYQTSASSWRSGDDRLFNRIRHNPQHVLYSLLPPPSTASQNYNLRPRQHDRQLPAHASHLMDCDFITRILYTKTFTNKTLQTLCFLLLLSSSLYYDRPME